MEKVVLLPHDLNGFSAKTGKKLTLFGGVIFILLGILLSSVLIEILQATVVSSRGAEWYDLLANFFGLATGYLTFLLIGDWKIFRFLKF